MAARTVPFARPVRRGDFVAVVAEMRAHVGVEQAACMAFALLYEFLGNNQVDPATQRAALEAGAIEASLAALQAHAASREVQEKGCAGRAARSRQRCTAAALRAYRRPPQLRARSKLTAVRLTWRVRGWRAPDTRSQARAQQSVPQARGAHASCAWRCCTRP
jgi:hypothetical protein